jgi:hypothetical protein
MLGRNPGSGRVVVELLNFEIVMNSIVTSLLYIKVSLHAADCANGMANKKSRPGSSPN